MNYDEILKCYNGVDDIHASTSFEFGLMNDLYYQLFTTTTMTGLELFIVIGGCYAIYTVGMAIATTIDYHTYNKDERACQEVV